MRGQYSEFSVKERLTCDSRDDVCCQLVARDIVDLVILLVLEEAHDLKVCQCPRMPRFVPCRIVVRREVV